MTTKPDSEPKVGRPQKLSIKEKEKANAPDKPPVKKKAGRKPNSNYIPFEDARELVHNELLHSRGAYEMWWDRNKPKAIPRFPYRVYKEWVSWNDFLGTNNEFRQPVRNWRPMEEAIHYVHGLRLTSQREWLEFCRDNAADVPEDIPKRPDVVYSKWVSWNHWLGNKPVEAIQAKVEAAKIGVFYIIHEQGVPDNVITYGLEPKGLTTLKEWWDRDKFDVIKTFWHEPDRAATVQQVIEAFSSPYLGDNKQRITPNVWQIVEQLQMILRAIR